MQKDLYILALISFFYQIAPNFTIDLRDFLGSMEKWKWDAKIVHL